MHNLDIFKEGKKNATCEPAPNRKLKIGRTNDSLPNAAKVENLMLEKSKEEGAWRIQCQIMMKLEAHSQPRQTY